jgi:hypothetical protein
MVHISQPIYFFLRQGVTEHFVVLWISIKRLVPTDHVPLLKDISKFWFKTCYMTWWLNISVSWQMVYFCFYDIPNCGNQFSVNTMYQVSELTVWPVLFIAEILFAIELCD